MSGKQAKAERARQRRQTREAAARATFWHGGPAGLQVGAILRPLTELTGLSAAARSPHPWYDDLKFQHVCATTDMILARDFAARWQLDAQLTFLRTLSPTGDLPERIPWSDTSQPRGGTLYRVEPLSPVTHDPDYPEGVSFRMDRARVLAIEEAHIPASETPSLEVLHYQEWETGERIYDDDGYAVATSIFTPHGITTADLRPLGSAPDPYDLLRYANELVARRRAQS